MHTELVALRINVIVDQQCLDYQRTQLESSPRSCLPDVMHQTCRACSNTNPEVLIPPVKTIKGYTTLSLSKFGLPYLIPALRPCRHDPVHSSKRYTHHVAAAVELVLNGTWRARSETVLCEGEQARCDTAKSRSLSELSLLALLWYLQVLQTTMSKRNLLRRSLSNLQTYLFCERQSV